jgi:DNA repair exonuclease SbcCD ATPase subunit
MGSKNMLIIHSVNPTGMFSYGYCDTVNVLNKGLVNLVGVNEDKGGDSNGSGKSSLFNSICELLFMENPTGEKGDSIVNSVWGKGMAGRLHFTNWNNENYRITYCRNWKDQQHYSVDNDNKTVYVGTSLFLDRYEDGSWRDCRGAGIPDTHKKILSLVGMSYQRFLSICYMSNRIGDQFLRGTNKDRVDILSGVTGVEDWDKILEESRSRRKVLQTRIDTLVNKIAFENGASQTLKEQLQNAKAFDWSTHIDGLTNKFNDAKEGFHITQAKLGQITYQIDEIKSAKESTSAKKNIDDLMISTNDLANNLKKAEADLGRPISVKDDQGLLNDFSSIANRLGEARGSLSTFLGSSASIIDVINCPTCDTKISKDKKAHLQQRIISLEEDVKSLEISYVSAQESIKKDRESKQRDAQKQKKQLSEKVAKIRADIEEKRLLILKERENLSSFDSEISSLQGTLLLLNNELNIYKSEGNKIKAQLESANANLKNIEALSNSISEKDRQAGLLETESKKIQEEQNIYTWLIENIPYIKLHKLSVSMAEISGIVNNYFANMGDSIRISITSFEEKTKKRGAADIKDLMKSEVKVEIIDGKKNISPKLYSDGEIGKVSMAVIRALHEMAKKFGQGCNIMMMDEVFSFIDVNNSQRISQVISKFMKKGTVFLTDNSGRVNDLVKFDNVWTVRKKNGCTTVEVE